MKDIFLEPLMSMVIAFLRFNLSFKGICDAFGGEITFRQVAHKFCLTGTRNAVKQYVERLGCPFAVELVPDAVEILGNFENVSQGVIFYCNNPIFKKKEIYCPS